MLQTLFIFSHMSRFSISVNHIDSDFAPFSLTGGVVRFFRTTPDRYPDVTALRFSMSRYRKQNWMRNMPLYAVGNASLWDK